MPINVATLGKTVPHKHCLAPPLHVTSLTCHTPHVTPTPQSRKSYIQLTTQSAPIPKREELHLFLKFSALALPVNEPCELLFFIYDARSLTPRPTPFLL